MTPPRVAVIILSYNRKDLALQALASVTRMSYPNYDVVLVDNGSSDGTSEAVSKAFPAVLVARTENNLAIAGGYNLGIRVGLERGADYLLSLNNDIEADRELVTELVRVAEHDPRIGAVGCKTYFHDDRRRLFSAGGELLFAHTITKERGHGMVDRGKYDRDELRLYANGNGLLLRRTAIEAAGLWDPVFHFAVEDADLCMRIRTVGFTVWFAYKAVLYHMVGKSLGNYVARRTYWSGRSNAIFVRRYAGPWQWLTFLVASAVALPFAYLRELPSGNQGAAVAKLRGLIAGMREPIPPPPNLADPISRRERADP